MSDTLNKKETKKLVELGKKIQLSLSCNINGTGLPSRTNRLQAVNDMVEYLKIHDCEVYERDEDNYLVHWTSNTI